MAKQVLSKTAHGRGRWEGRDELECVLILCSAVHVNSIAFWPLQYSTGYDVTNMPLAIKDTDDEELQLPVPVVGFSKIAYAFARSSPVRTTVQKGHVGKKKRHSGRCVTVCHKSC